MTSLLLRSFNGMFPGQPGKPVPECRTILGVSLQQEMMEVIVEIVWGYFFWRALYKCGIGDNRNSKTYANRQDVGLSSAA